MKKIAKGNTPDFWDLFVRKNPKVMYKDLDITPDGPEVRSQLRTYLSREQGHVCCYCCSVLSDGESHNEHIRPESLYPRLTMDYNNIIVSCTRTLHSNNSSCGMQKENKYDERLFVSPLADDCSKHFIFYSNGSIDSDTDPGKYTIELLRLHESNCLKAGRRNQYNAVYYLCSSEVADVCSGLSSRYGEEYALAKELYQDFFDNVVSPDYFSKKDGRFPAYVDMLDYFKEHGEFDFDNIVTDLVISGRLQFVSD
jgi:uncharacterized protein (TIGR02646 family)